MRCYESAGRNDGRADLLSSRTSLSRVRLHRNSCTAAFLFLASGLAHTAHPLNTDDTGTQGKGNNQVELNTDLLRQVDTRTHVAGLTYSFGTHAHMDVFVDVPQSISNPSGVNDVTLGFKWRFFDDQMNSTALRADFLLPSGDADKGLGTGRTSMALTLIESHSAAPWVFHANAGVALNRYALSTDRDSKRVLIWRASVAAVYSATPNLKLIADTGISQNTERFNSTVPGYLLTGAIYSPSPDIDLDAGLRVGIGCTGCADRIDRQVGVGVTWRF